jgi:hypothetical protein
MADPIIRFKRSAVPGKKPTLEQLPLGELAINTYDGRILLKQDRNGVGIGTRIVEAGAATTAGKTLFVTMNGSDDNTGLNQIDSKRTIGAAVSASGPYDTIRIFPGTYVESNPINMCDNLGIEGAELRNCIVTPSDPSKDLFYMGNGCHITNISFMGQPSTNGAAVVSLRPLLGTAADRYFDAARMIRNNIEFIARETVGYITSTDYRNPAFNIGIGTVNNCIEDIRSIWNCVCHDITRGGNSKCVGAGKSYYNGGAIQHIVGVKTETIDAIQYSAGIVRSIINNATWGSKSAGIGSLSVTNATYDRTTGVTTITVANHGLLKDDPVKIIGLGFTCNSGPGTVIYPDGSFGYIFPVKSVVGVNTFEVVVGVSTLDHFYTSGGTVEKYTNYQNEFTQVKDLSMQADPLTGFNNSVNSCANVVSAIYSCVGIVTTIIDVGLSASGINTNYPGNNGAINSGILTSSLSPLQGTGPVTKGPYVRNCTNFIPNSIGAKIDGFNSEVGDQGDIGIQGAFHVDSYTQYNQGGIGVSITNGAYAQLVSIFTICTDRAIYTGQGGQLDLTNSNSSFGREGLVSEGVGDETTKSTDRYTAGLTTLTTRGDNVVVLSGVGTFRPYSGQSVYFDKKYYSVQSATVTNPGAGYSTPPLVTVTAPTGPGNAIPAQLTANLNSLGGVDSINILTTGFQYELDSPPVITIAAPVGGGVTATAEPVLSPIYYLIDSATLPSSGITTVSLVQNLNNDVGAGLTAYFARQSLQIASSHSFEYIGAGNAIETARPSKGGVTVQENEVVKIDGGEVIYTSTDQDGNFRIGDGVIIDQTTGTISGAIYVKSLFSQVTPFILALGGD